MVLSVNEKWVILNTLAKIAREKPERMSFSYRRKKSSRNEAASLPSLREPIYIRRSRNQSSIVNLQFSIVKNDIDDSHDVRHIDIAVLIDIRIHFIEW